METPTPETITPNLSIQEELKNRIFPISLLKRINYLASLNTKTFTITAKKTITLTKDESLIKTGQFSDNTMHSSIMDFIGNVIDL